MFLVRLLEVGFCKSWGRDGFQWIPVFPDKSDGLQAFVIARSYRKCLGVSVACHPCCQTRMSPSRHPKCSLRGEQSNLMQSDGVITSQVHKCGQLYRDNQRIRLGDFSPTAKLRAGSLRIIVSSTIFQKRVGITFWEVAPMVRSLVGMHVITLVTAFRSLEMATEKAAFSAKQCLTGQLNLI